MAECVYLQPTFIEFTRDFNIEIELWSGSKTSFVAYYVARTSRVKYWTVTSSVVSTCHADYIGELCCEARELGGPSVVTCGPLRLHRFQIASITGNCIDECDDLLLNRLSAERSKFVSECENYLTLAHAHSILKTDLESGFAGKAKSIKIL